MINKEDVKEEIEKAETAYEQCWDYLCKIKTGQLSNSFEILINFQPELAEALFRLGNFYHNIALEKKNLLSKKNNLSSECFSSQMSMLGNFQKAINRTILIGKGLGDAFAWFFYQRNRHYLNEHLSHDEILYIPRSVGGIGELEFIKNVPILGGYFVLYHGTTNILRLGDITLIDLKQFSVAGIGELKTSSLNDEYINVHLLFSGPGIDIKQIQKYPRKISEKKEEISQNFSKKIADRLSRQLKQINKSYVTLSAKCSIRIDFETNNSMGVLNSLFQEYTEEGKIIFKHASNGLVLGIYTDPRNSFSDRLLDKLDTDTVSGFNEMEDCALALILPDRLDNSLVIGALYYDKKGNVPLLSGMSHLFWWPVQLEFIKKIIFHKTMIMTLLNPAQLANTFEVAGFTVEYKDKRISSVYKKEGGKKFSVGGINYYLKMISQYLFTEQSIVDHISEMERKTKEMDIEGATKIELRIEQQFGSSPIHRDNLK